MLSKFSGSRQDQQFVLLLVILLATLGISLFLAVSMGSVAIDLGDTYRIILSRLGFPLEIGEVSKSTLAIVWNMRFPRVLLGLIVGAGLSMCGSVMQSTVNNPIAEPYVLGISAGATLGATLSIILGLKVMISLGAFLGAIFGNNCCPYHCLYAGKDDDFQSNLIRNGGQCSLSGFFQLYYLSWC